MKRQVPLWWIRCMNFEYWPMWLIYLPISPYLLWLMFKCRSIHFYKYINPSIKNGGLIGESKKLILDSIKPEFKPVTILFPPGISPDEIKMEILKYNLKFPVIAKPDIGEQGKGVEKISDWGEMESYLEGMTTEFIIQEYVDFPIELAIFFLKYPGENNGRITSITKKKFLSISGNGTNSIAELLTGSDRARFQIKRLKHRFGVSRMSHIPEAGEEIIIDVVGNHCRGTLFLNGSELINEKLERVFSKISNSINGFYFGRYDLKVSNFEDLNNGKNIRIVELNGAGAIPAHIFDPDYKLLNAWKDILFHWKKAGEIAIINKKGKVQLYGN